MNRDSKVKQEILDNLMSPSEVLERIECLENVDRRDFYTDGKLDLAKAERRGKLGQIKGFSCDGNGKIIDIQLYNDHSGIVYLIRAENGLIKIGQTTKLAKRLSAIDNASPTSVKLVSSGFVLNRRKVESELHSKFAGRRIKGEWFDLSETETNKAIRILSDYVIDEE